MGNELFGKQDFVKSVFWNIWIREKKCRTKGKEDVEKRIFGKGTFG